MSGSEDASGAGWERLFWLVFGQSANPIVLTDGERRIVEINDAALEMLGYSRGSVTGRRLTELMIPDELEDSARTWQSILTRGQSSGTRTFVRGNGEEVPVEWAARAAVIGGRRLAIFVASVPHPNWPTRSPEDSSEELTPREQEVVSLIALGDDTAAIAQRLVISPATVRTHVRNAMTKLGAKTRAQLVANGLLREDAIRLPHLTE
jgi:PAS domain S-box-containing protein